MKCNVTLIAVTTLVLSFVAMAMESYEIYAAAIFSEYETSTTPMDNTNGADYEEETTTARDSFMYMDSKPNASSASCVSGFDISLYHNNCTEVYEYENGNQFQYMSYNGEFLHNLTATASELCEEFHVLLKTAMRFTCTANETMGHDVIYKSQTYVRKCKEFLAKLNASMLDQNEAALDKSDAPDTGVYEMSVLRAQRLVEVAEQLTDLVTGQAKIDILNNSIAQYSEEEYFLNTTLVLEIIVREQEERISLLKNCMQKAVNVSKYTEENGFLALLVSNHTSPLLDVRYWSDLLKNESETLRRYKESLFGGQHDQFILYTVKPAVTAIVFVVGITGNGLLLAIFIRYKETRTLPNSMLMNLTAVDCVSLLINMLLDYLRIISPWKLGLPMCKLFYLSRYVFVAVSTYSVVTISVQRFTAVRQLPSRAMCHLGKRTKYVVMATIWALGIILSVPHALIAKVEDDLCYELSFEHFGPVSTADLVLFCVVPVILVAVFSGLTAARIRRSVCSIPGEGAGQDRMRQNRMVSSNIMIALAVLFVVSYTPYYLYSFLTIQVGVKTTGWQFNTVNVVTYYLRFVNCCLNPLVLFVMSKRYRGYMKKYFCCGDRKELDASKSDNIKDTSL
jgi:hypothetical protein